MDKVYIDRDLLLEAAKATNAYFQIKSIVSGLPEALVPPARKQSTGCEYCATDNEKCGTCVKFFDYYKDGGSDRCYTAHNSEKCVRYEPIDFCPKCGAKMKGE